MAFESNPYVSPLHVMPGVSHGYHLYAVRWNAGCRDDAYNLLRSHGIGVNVHYIPVHLHPFFKKFGFKKGNFPVSERHSRTALSIPMFYKIKKNELSRVIKILKKMFKN